VRNLSVISFCQKLGALPLSGELFDPVTRDNDPTGRIFNSYELS